MAAKNKIVCGKIHLFPILIFIGLIYAETHWLLEEDGFIRRQRNSWFMVKDPGDLLLFLLQTKKADELRRLEKESDELTRQHNELLSMENLLKNQERVAFKMDPDCTAAKKKLSAFDLHLSSFLRLDVKGIKYKDYLDYSTTLPNVVKKPYCTTELLFSMKSYDHLKGVADRKLLKNVTEEGLVNPIPLVKNIVEYGHRVHEALKKNETSWVLLNFAAIYWRVNGNSLQAVECLRRALHNSPRKDRDLALVSLGNILHRSSYSLDAAVLMHAALEVTMDYDIVYFTLGNIYGALGQFDLADICYKYVTELQPNFNAAKVRMHAARCEYKLNYLAEHNDETKAPAGGPSDFQHDDQLESSIEDEPIITDETEEL